MSSLRVNTITNTAGTGPVEFTKGVSVPSGQVIKAPNINLTGIVTATTFNGSGANLTFAGSIPVARSIAFTLIT